jgi:hypothetical protein
MQQFLNRFAVTIDVMEILPQILTMAQVKRNKDGCPFPEFKSG